MLPNNELSEEAEASAYLTPVRLSELIDYEFGGQGLNTPSQDMLEYLWKAEYVDGEIILKREDSEVIAERISVSGVLKLGLAFDQNMRYVLCYQIRKDSYIYWYDATINQWGTFKFDNCTSPCISLDDGRLNQKSNSDVIFSYVRNGGLYYRIQRERYLVEHMISERNIGELWQIGMTVNNRFQFTFKQLL